LGGYGNKGGPNIHIRKMHVMPQKTTCGVLCRFLQSIFFSSILPPVFSLPAVLAPELFTYILHHLSKGTALLPTTPVEEQTGKKGGKPEENLNEDREQ
jgi:hypothetical protein